MMSFLRRLLRAVAGRCRPLGAAPLGRGNKDHTVETAAPQKKEDILDTFSHDLRKPLNRIVASTRYLLDSHLNPEQLSDLGRIQVATDQLLNLTNELHDYGHLREASLELDRIPFSIRGALRKTVSQLQFEARERNISLAFEIDPSVPDALIGDPVRLRQTLENLGSEIVENTFRLPFGQPFSGSGIRAGIRKEDSTSPQPVLHFYFQGDEGFPGVREGLQYQVASRLVALMGGRLWQEYHQGHVRGLHFTMALPLQESPLTVDSLKHFDSSNLRAIIIDNFSVDRTLLDNALKSWKIQTTITTEAEEAITRIADASARGEPFDLIFMDHLQEGSAFRFVERLKDCDLLSKSLIFLIVANGQRGDAALCRQLGIAGYFVKPVLPGEMREAISLARHYHDSPRDHAPLITRHLLEEEDRRLKILYADHDPKKQQEAIRLLEYQGHQVLTADSGASVLSLLEKQAFDLILMDPKIQNLDGLATTSRIREKEKETGGHTPIIGMAASLEQEEKKKCLDAGMDVYIAHPLHSSHFTEVIKNLGLD